MPQIDLGSAIVFYIASTTNYLSGIYNVDCDIENFCAFSCASELDVVKKAYSSQLIQIGQGIKVTKPIEFINDGNTYMHSQFSSISHEGIFVYLIIKDDVHAQFINLITDEKYIVPNVGISIFGFYDDNVIIISGWKKMRDGKLDDLLRERNPQVLKTTGKYPMLSQYSDVSVINITRQLYYSSVGHIPMMYNVDTKVHSRLFEKMFVYSYASLTGIDVGVSAIFRQWSGGSTIKTLNKDESVSTIYEEKQTGPLVAVIPSSSDNKNLDLCAKVYECGKLFFKERRGVIIKKFIRYTPSQTIVRIYKDVFFVLDENTSSWMCMRIIIP